MDSKKHITFPTKDDDDDIGVTNGGNIFLNMNFGFLRIRVNQKS